MAFWRSPAPVRGFVGGIGSGKTFAGAFDLIMRARPGRLYMVTAPTYKVLRDSTLRGFLPLARGFSYLLGWNKSDLIATLGNGADVLFRSTEDPDHLRGPNASGAWMDEGSLSPREAYHVLLGRLREAGEMGWLSTTFTPKGRAHWTFDVFGRRPTPDVALFHARTSDNPFLPAAFVPTMQRQYDGLQARQELEGVFVELGGAEWPDAYFPDSLWFNDWPEGLLARAAALDPSKGRDARQGDYAAFALLAVDSDGVLWCEADLYRGRSAEYLAEAAVAHQRSFRPDVLAVESNQFLQLFAVIIDQVARRRGVLVPVVELHNQAPKPVRIRRLGPYLAQGRLRFRDTPGTRLLVDQLREFPEGAHDDGPDALEMALRVLADLLAERDQGREGPTVLRT